MFHKLCFYWRINFFFNLIIVSKSIKIGSILANLTETNALDYYTVLLIDDPCCSTNSIVSVGKTPVVVCWLENVLVFVFLLMNQLFFNLILVPKSIKIVSILAHLISDWLTVTNTLAYYTIIFINVLCCSTKSIISGGNTPVVVCWLENALVFVFFAESTFFNVIIVSKSVKIVSFFAILTETSALA